MGLWGSGAFRKAADQGDAVAEFLLGNQYANGGGVPQDFSEAMIWFGRAAAQAHPIAMLHLGAMYAERPRRAAGLCPCPHVVQSGGGTGSANSGQNFGNGRTEDDPSSDNRSAEARTRLEAGYAASSSLAESYCSADDRCESIASFWSSADYFRSSPGNRHRQGWSPCLKGATSGLMQRSLIRSDRRRDQGWRGRAGVAAYGGKRHVGHPGPKPVQAYRVQSW